MKIVFTDAYIKNIKKPGRYTDAATRGLNFNVKNGRGYWAFRYKYGEKRLDLSLGAYPGITLKEARKRAVAARNDVLNGIKPKANWRAEVTLNMENQALFKDFAKQCIEAKKAEWKNSKHINQWFNTIEQYANPIIGAKHLGDIDTQDILEILNPLWYTKTETASRLRGRLEWILASATTRRFRSGLNPATWKGHLETILPKPTKIVTVKHHPALPYKEIPSFMANLREKDGVACLALEFLILNTNRSAEVLNGLRSEVTENGLWVIPADRMKARREHRIPLGKRSLEILTISAQLDQNSKYLFSKNGKPLSNMAMAMLLRKVNPEITVHGFRSTFRDWVAEETSHSSEVAEKALAHTITNKVERAYRRGDLLEHRKCLMKDWEDYCTTGTWGNVIVIENRQKVA